MKIQIDNQIVEITGNTTIITVVRKPYGNYKEKFDFDLRDFPNHAEKIKNKNIAEYFWLERVYASFNQLKNGTQLKLF